MKIVGDNPKDIAVNQMVELTEGQQILFSPENGGRLAQVQLVQA